MLWAMDDTLHIHLSKPGGQREGPYSLAQINRDLASRKYRDTDYWAWHEGLTEWVPLYAVAGVITSSQPAPRAGAVPEPAEAAATASPPALLRPAAVTPAPVPPAALEPAAAATADAGAAAPESAAADAMTASAAPSTDLDKAVIPAPPQIASGMPFSALEQIFVFTTGDGPAVWESSMAIRMLEGITGEKLDTIREAVARDVFGRCDIGQRLRRDGTIPESAWRAMWSLKPDLVQEAQKGAHRVCVRTFPVETGDVVAVFLFYNKQKLPA